MKLATIALNLLFCAVLISLEVKCAYALGRHMLEKHTAQTGVSVTSHDGRAFAASSASVKVDGEVVKKEVRNVVSDSANGVIRSTRAGADVIGKDTVIEEVSEEAHELALKLALDNSPAAMTIIMKQSDEGGVINQSDMKALLSTVGGSCVRVLMRDGKGLKLDGARFQCRRMRIAFRRAVLLSRMTVGRGSDAIAQDVKNGFVRRVVRFVGQRATEALSSAKVRTSVSVSTKSDKGASVNKVYSDKDGNK